MAVRKETIYAMHRPEPDYAVGIGDSFFTTGNPHKAYYRTTIYTVTGIDSEVTTCKRSVVKRYEPYFMLESRHSVNRVTLGPDIQPRYLAIKIIDNEHCLFAERPEQIHIIGRYPRMRAWYDKNISHVFSVNTRGFYDTKYKCSGQKVNKYITLVHKDPILISQLQEYQHLITCTNCQRRMEKWTE